MTTPAQPQAIRQLRDALTPEEILTSTEERYRGSMDNLRYSQMPALVIRPRSEDSIGTVLELANTWCVPVTTRGAGSATTGAATPTADGWVLDLSNWNEVHVDPLSRMAYAQPGVTLAALDAAAGRHGLTYPVDPGSRAYATIGGTIATNAGGMRGARYGVTRDYVLSLEGFLPTGEFVRWGADLRKFSVGYNVRDLWIGSEGTLGIITGCVLRLLPRPASRQTLLALFPGNREALEAAAELLSSGCSPSALEFLDTQTVACTLDFWKATDAATLDSVPSALKDLAASPNPASALLVEVEGDPAALEADRERALSVLQPLARHCAAGAGPADTEALWKLRRSCSQAMFRLGRRKLNEDVVVPASAQVALLDFLEDTRRRTGLPTPTFGHAADGNFHAHIMFDDREAEQKRLAEKAVQALMGKVVDLGGAISGEHGIGLAKSPFISLQHGPAEVRVMRALKTLFDPNHILNPGKIWEPAQPWDFPREEVRLPWDH